MLMYDLIITRFKNSREMSYALEKWAGNFKVVRIFIDPISLALLYLEADKEKISVYANPNNTQRIFKLIEKKYPQLREGDIISDAKIINLLNRLTK